MAAPTNQENFSESKEGTSSKIEDLFGHGVKISYIEDGDEIPVGGKVFADEMDTIMECDFDDLHDFNEFFGRALDQLTEESRAEKINVWLEESGVDVDPELFAKLVAFRKTYDKKIQQQQDDTASRKRFSTYKKGENKRAKLSEVLQGGTQRCAEIAALAQYALQKGGVDSAYIGGDILRGRDSEFAGEHSFILIEHNGEEYIYDPANSVKTNQGQFPSLYTTESNFNGEIHQQEKRLVKAENVISEQEVYFGVSDGTNIIPDRDLVE